MSHQKIKPGEIVNLYSTGGDLPEEATVALVKSSDMEVIRMVLPKDKEVNEHSVDGELSVQCLEGRVEFTADNKTQVLSSGDWLYLERNQPHSLKVVRDAILLVTILFVNNTGPQDD